MRCVCAKDREGVQEAGTITIISAVPVNKELAIIIDDLDKMPDGVLHPAPSSHLIRETNNPVIYSCGKQ